MLNESVAWLAREIPLGEFLIQDLLLATGLIATLSLFLGIKNEMRNEARRHKQAIEELKARLGSAPLDPRGEFALAITGHSHAPARPPALSEPAPALSIPSGVRSGFNLQHRTQAIRLLRRGEDVSHVSAALGVPRCEVELLIRVQELASKRAVRMN